MRRITVPNLFGSGVEVIYRKFEEGNAATEATEAWSIRPPNGPNVSLHWNPDPGQWTVSILTEEGDVAADEKGCPYLYVTVNDSVVHDYEPGGIPETPGMWDRDKGTT